MDSVCTCIYHCASMWLCFVHVTHVDSSCTNFAFIHVKSEFSKHSIKVCFLVAGIDFTASISSVAFQPRSAVGRRRCGRWRVGPYSFLEVLVGGVGLNCASTLFRPGTKTTY